mgnify:CR=1 FL=1
MKSLSHALPLAALLAAALSAVPAAADPIGNVEDVAGEAHGTPPNGVRRQLAVAETLVQDEFVETQPGGGMTVVFLDGTEFRLGSNSSALLDRFLYDPNAAGGDGVVQLGQGVFRFISGGQTHDGVQVQTPNSVIGIRGTDFVVVVDRDNGTTVGTQSGLIEVTALRSGQNFAVDPGRVGRIQPDGSVAVEEAPVPVDQLACWLSQDSYVCVAEASGTGTSPLGDDLGGQGPGPGQDPTDPGPGPGPGPGPSDPGDDAGNDPNDPGPSDPGNDPGPGDPGGSSGDPADGDP